MAPGEIRPLQVGLLPILIGDDNLHRYVASTGAAMLANNKEENVLEPYKRMRAPGPPIPGNQVWWCR